MRTACRRGEDRESNGDRAERVPCSGYRRSFGQRRASASRRPEYSPELPVARLLTEHRAHDSVDHCMPPLCLAQRGTVDCNRSPFWDHSRISDDGARKGIALASYAIDIIYISTSRKLSYQQIYQRPLLPGICPLSLVSAPCPPRICPARSVARRAAGPSKSTSAKPFGRSPRRK